MQTNMYHLQTKVVHKNGSTGGMIFHLKRYHGLLSRNNAWKMFEELSSLKEDRLKTCKRKRSVNDFDDQRKNTRNFQHVCKVSMDLQMQGNIRLIMQSPA
jgi:hypothetical protein